jgi:hypothetical protein
MEDIKFGTMRSISLRTLDKFYIQKPEVIDKLKRLNSKIKFPFLSSETIAMTPIYTPGPKPSKLLLDYIHSPKPHKITKILEIKQKLQKNNPVIISNSRKNSLPKIKK